MDYLEVARNLRVKAADRAVGPEESRILIEKAKELEEKYSKGHSPSPAWKEELVDSLVESYISPATLSKILYDFPDDWYESMDDWGDISDWYSGEE